MEFAGFVKANLVGLDAERGKAARGAVGEHDPHQFPAMRNVVVQPRLHHDFLHRGGEAFGSVGVDVEQGRRVPNGARVRLVASRASSIQWVWWLDSGSGSSAVTWVKKLRSAGGRIVANLPEQGRSVDRVGR